VLSACERRGGRVGARGGGGVPIAAVFVRASGGGAGVQISARHGGGSGGAGRSTSVPRASGGGGICAGGSGGVTESSAVDHGGGITACRGVGGPIASGLISASWGGSIGEGAARRRSDAASRGGGIPGASRESLTRGRRSGIERTACGFTARRGGGIPGALGGSFASGVTSRIEGATVRIRRVNVANNREAR